jgi:hypothetical protein
MTESVLTTNFETVLNKIVTELSLPLRASSKCKEFRTHKEFYEKPYASCR